MVRQDDVVLWFSRQQSHQRLDVLCKLASICVPLELRFVHTYVDFLVRKSAPPPRDCELLAQYEKICHPLTDIDLHQEDSRRKLVFTLMMLSSTNRPVASSIYRILYDSCSNWNTFGLDITIETCLELCLIFTMALHHPAFTFDERMNLGKIYSTLSKQYAMWSILEGVSPSTPSPQPQHSPPEERCLVNGSTGSTSSSSSSSVSNHRSKSVQNDRSLRHRHRNSPKTNGSNAIDSITNQLKDLLGDERFPKGWRHFEKYSPSELMACSDQEFHRCGLSSNFISHLRKVLSSQSMSNHSVNNHSSQKTNGLLITADEHTKHMPLNKPVRPVKTCMGPPNVQPAFNNSHRINEQQKQPPPVDQSVSRSSSSSGSSSDACSPPSSPTDSSTLAHRVESQRKAYPQPIMMLNTGNLNTLQFEHQFFKMYFCFNENRDEASGSSIRAEQPGHAARSDGQLLAADDGLVPGAPATTGEPGSVPAARVALREHRVRPAAADDARPVELPARQQHPAASSVGSRPAARSVAGHLHVHLHAQR